MEKNMIHKAKIVFCVLGFSLLSFVSCDNFGGENSNKLTDINVSEDKSNVVNVIDQAKPAIMVIPSDLLLKKNNAIQEVQDASTGQKTYVRDYNKYLLNDENNRAIIGIFESYFSSRSYPLMDLERSLKSIENEKAFDEVDLVQKDARSMLMQTCRPDIIIEIDYSLSNDIKSRVLNDNFNYSITIIDAFTNKAINSVQKSDISIGNKPFLAAATSYIEKSMHSVANSIQEYFADQLFNGREITFRVTTGSQCNIKLDDEYNDSGDCYSDWIREWVKTHAKKGAATMQRNTSNEMYFINVRITNSSDDGTQNNAYEFSSDFRKAFRQTFDIKCSNMTQGLGDGYVIIGK